MCRAAHRLNSSLASYKAVSYVRAMKVVATLGYDRRARKLFTPAERAAAELEIARSPTAWPVIRGTGGAREARAARGGRGKSGGSADHLLCREPTWRHLPDRYLCQERERGPDRCRK